MKHQGFKNHNIPTAMISVEISERVLWNRRNLLCSAANFRYVIDSWIALYLTNILTDLLKNSTLLFFGVCNQISSEWRSLKVADLP